MNDLINAKYHNIRNWSYELKNIFEETDQMYLFDTETVYFRLENVLKTTKERLFDNFKYCWQVNLNDYPKLRTYRMFKSEFCLEPYVSKFLTRSERSFLAQFRLGIYLLIINRLVNIRQVSNVFSNDPSTTGVTKVNYNEIK